MTHYLVAASCVLLATMSLAFFSPSAEAHRWGPYKGDTPFNEEPRFANNSTHVFCYESLSAGSITVAGQARIEALGKPTDMTTDLDCTGARVDVHVHDSNYGRVGWRGAYSCRALNGNNNCADSDVYINLEYLANLDQRRKTMCHEFGHSIGLRHDTDSGCMQSGASTAKRYTAHEINDHINVRY